MVSIRAPLKLASAELDSEGWRNFLRVYPSSMVFARARLNLSWLEKFSPTKHRTGRNASAGMRPPGVRIASPFVIIVEFDPVERGPAVIVVIRA